MDSKITSEETTNATINDSPLEIQEEVVQKRFHNDKLMIITLLITSVVAFLLYVIPDWVFIEIPTRDIIRMALTLVGIDNSPIPYNGADLIPLDLRGGSFPFLEATVQTPGIFLPTTNGQYWIVKACTGMQAGSLLLAMIFVSDATWNARFKASIVFFFTLFIGNTARIAFHLWCVTILFQYFDMDPETAFYWAHDVSSKIIGFFGTIGFAILIEKMDVPIIDTFADWLDWMFWRINKVTDKISGK